MADDELVICSRPIVFFKLQSYQRAGIDHFGKVSTELLPAKRDQPILWKKTPLWIPRRSLRTFLYPMVDSMSLSNLQSLPVIDLSTTISASWL